MCKPNEHPEYPKIISRTDRAGMKTLDERVELAQQIVDLLKEQRITAHHAQLILDLAKEMVIHQSVLQPLTKQ